MLLFVLQAADWTAWWPFREPTPPTGVGGLVTQAVAQFIKQVYWTGALHGAIVATIVMILLYLVAQLLSPTQLRKKRVPRPPVHINGPYWSQDPYNPPGGQHYGR
jgi:hypothetical protein